MSKIEFKIVRECTSLNRVYYLPYSYCSKFAWNSWWKGKSCVLPSNSPKTLLLFSFQGFLKLLVEVKNHVFFPTNSSKHPLLFFVLNFPDTLSKKSRVFSFSLSSSSKVVLLLCVLSFAKTLPILLSFLELLM